MRLGRSAEDYLEAMLVLGERNGYIRAADVADRLGVSRPSVSVAVRRLRENGYIRVGEDDLISLTDSGSAVARGVYERHRVLTGLFTQLGVDPATAQSDACRVEHDISDATFEALKKLYGTLRPDDRKDDQYD